MVSIRQNAKLALLKGVPIFEGFSKKELIALSRATEQLEYGAGEVLARQNFRVLPCTWTASTGEPSPFA